MTDEDITIDEKRVYDEKSGATTTYVATSAGLARVNVSDDIVGEFSLDYRGETVDVAADDRLAVATPEDVLLETADGFAETGFGPATAVGFDGDLLAAGDGRLARYDDGWEPIADIEDVRAISGGLVAAADGVYRTDGTSVGLDGANDVAADGDLLAATDAGLYYLANGWMQAREGAFLVVAAGDDRAHAATADGLFERTDGGTESGAGDDWVPVDLPVGGRIADVAYDEATYAVTEDGTFFADAGDGWRHRSLGLPGVVGLAVR
ncbi:HVO_0234 family beta-propeller protein [Natronomonas amylolytica]|uniref:HVO_0234 family beta-propeller protein n=1 Tax=Natronomonas amylolytica TaxID=3108498 RepID=UPI00300982BA